MYNDWALSIIFIVIIQRSFLKVFYMRVLCYYNVKKKKKTKHVLSENKIQNSSYGRARVCHAFCFPREYTHLNISRAKKTNLITENYWLTVCERGHYERG